MANFFDIDVELLKQEGIDFKQLDGGKAVITAKDEKQKKFLETLLKLYEADEKSASDRWYEHKKENHEANLDKNNDQSANLNNNVVENNNNVQNNNNINIQNQNEDNNNQNMNQNNPNNAHKYQDNGTGIKPLKMLRDYLKEIQSKHKIKLKDIKVKALKQQEQKKTK